jgi:Nif-specific regulatory protein
MNYDWPGNVRELENTIERIVVMCSGKTATKADLPINIRDHSLKARFASQMKDALPSTIEDIEKTKLVEALTRTGWSQAKAARILGITPRQIGYKIKKYDLRQP